MLEFTVSVKPTLPDTLQWWSAPELERTSTCHAFYGRFPPIVLKKSLEAVAGAVTSKDKSCAPYTAYDLVACNKVGGIL